MRLKLGTAGPSLTVGFTQTDKQPAMKASLSADDMTAAAAAAAAQSVRCACKSTHVGKTTRDT